MKGNHIITDQGNLLTYNLNQYQKRKTQLVNCFANIYFNKRCLKLNIIPNYTKIITKHNNIKIHKLIKQLQINWIKYVITEQYKKINYLNEQLLNIHLLLANTLDQHTWNTKYNIINYRIRNYKKEKFITVNKKLTTLIAKNKQNNTDSKTTDIQHQFHNKFINLSDINFTEKETNILESCNKTNLKIINEHTIENIIVETEYAINKLENTKQDEIRTQATMEITKFIKKYNMRKQNNQKQNIDIKNIKHKLNTNNLTLIKADKSNANVIIDSNELEAKTIKFINENNCILLNKDPTSKFQTQISNLIKNNSSQVLNNKNKNIYKMDNPIAPKLNTLIKLHKTDKPIRPLINSKTAPNYKIGKIITKILKEKLQLENKYNIKNSIQLTENLINTQISSDTKLYSFDITNMYTNIPVDNTINLIENTLNNKKESRIYIKQITNILHTILKQNYFEYNNKIYQQTDGLAMGAPTSAIISETFLQEIDKSIINIIKENDPHGIYYRYVDDAIYISQNNGININKITQEINKIHNKIKFTVEEETNNKLNYLDLTISKTTTKLEFSIYRKPTQTNLIIPNSSNHPPQQKMAAFNSLIYRMLRLPLNDTNKAIEREIIQQIATDNGYSIKTINKLENKIKQKLNNQVIPTSQQNTNNQKTKTNPYTTFTYYGPINHKLTKIFKNAGLKISYNTNNIIFNKITPKLNIEDTKRNGVYKIQCPQCNKFYVGQTKKPLLERFLQHKNAYAKPDIYKSNLATHALTNKHIFPDIENIKLIKSIPKGQKMNIWENLYIHKHTDNNTLIKEQTQIKTRQDSIFKILKFIHNTKTNTNTQQSI